MNSKRKIAAAVAAFFETNFGDTDAQVAESKKAAVEKLCKTVNGRDLRLVYPIEGVAPPEDQKGYKLNLSIPDFPQGSWRFQTSTYKKLTKAESLKIVPSTSLLIVQGKVRVEVSDRPEEMRRQGPRGNPRGRNPRNGGGQQGAAGQPGGGKENDSVLSWESPAALPGGGRVTRSVLLYLDNPKTTVQYEPEKAKTAN